MYNELYHHGVKGQRWGVRRYQNKDGSLTPAGKKRNNKKEKANRKSDLKNRRTMSDADLRKKIDRLKMEKEFKSLSKEDLNPGRKFVSDFMNSAGKKVLTAAAAGAMVYGVRAAITKKFDVQEAVNYVFPNPNKKK